MSRGSRRSQRRLHWTRLAVGGALGLSLAWSCGGGGRGCGGGGGGCTTDCDNCQPLENLYQCITPDNVTVPVCAIDDNTAGQHCAAIGATLFDKTLCPGGQPGAIGGTRNGDEESGDAPPSDVPKADDTANGG